MGPLTVKPLRLAGVCWEKTKRQIVSSAGLYDKVFLIIDAEGRNKQQVYEEIMKHTPRHIRNKVCVIIFDFMVEEWVCRGLGISYGSKPSEDISEWLRKEKGYKYKYEKRMLPEFVYKLDIPLLREDSNFRLFIEKLNDP